MLAISSRGLAGGSFVEMDSEQAGAVTMESPSRVAQWLMPGWKRALKTISMLGAATAIGAVCVFLTQTLLARELGPNDYGLFASSLATITMIAPLAGFGLAQFRLKRLRRGRLGGAALDRARRCASPSAPRVAALAIIVGWALFVAPDADTRYDLLVLIPVVLHILAIEMLSNQVSAWRIATRAWPGGNSRSRSVACSSRWPVARAATDRPLRRDELRADLPWHGGVGLAAVAR